MHHITETYASYSLFHAIYFSLVQLYVSSDVDILTTIHRVPGWWIGEYSTYM